MNRTLILADELNLPTSSGAATSFSQATVVRLVNTDTAAHIVTVVKTQGGTGIGSITLPPNSVEQVVKASSYCVFADSDKVRGTKVGFTN